MSESALSLLKHFRKANRIPKGGQLLVAVSGGADSVALLHLYTRLRDEMHLAIYAATFDHGLRGDIGRSDAEFVMEISQRWDVPCIIGFGRLDMQQPSVEARARAARYEFLAAAARDFGADYIATAHHADDQAETILLNLIRGTGARGLGGMKPVMPLPAAHDLTLVRPLLAVRRSALEAYCRAEKIEWRDDATNADIQYRRNWARHVVMPLLREANPNITESLSRSASIIADEDAYLTAQTAALMQSAASFSQHHVWIARAVFASWDAVIQRRALMQAAAHVSPAFEPDSGHLHAALWLLGTKNGGETDFSGGVQVIVDSGYVTVTRKGAPWTPPHAGFWRDIGEPERNSHVIDPASSMALPSENNVTITVYAPRNAVIRERSRKNGDRVFPVSLNGDSQKLKDWFINHKVPRQLRDHLPLIDADGQIVALWDGQSWQFFSPRFEAETVEFRLSLR